MLESHGISVETLDLSEVLGRIQRMKDNDDRAQAKLEGIKKYVSTSGVPAEALLKMAKLAAVVDDWMKATDVAISAVQCWTSIEENLGVVPCTVMSMMSNDLMSSACEVDICGVLAMHALQLASGTPSALLDWNNNYGDDPNKAVCFHCSNLPKHFFNDVKMDYQAIIAGTVGIENTYGTCVGKVKAAPMSYARFSTDDTSGQIARLRGRRRIHRRCAEYVWRRGRGGDSGDAEAAALHLRERIRAPRGGEPFDGRTGHLRGDDPVSGLGHVLPRTALEAQMAIVAGVDFGTLSVRVSIVDSERGLLDSAVANYPLHRKREDPEYATQSHDDHMRALAEATREALKKSGVAGEAVEAIAIDTTGSSVIPVGKGMVPLGEYYLWCDHRAKGEAAEITEAARREGLEAIEWCGGVYSSEWGFSKLLHWLRHNPEKRGEFVSAFEHCDFVAATLCGITDARQAKRSICAMGHKWMWNASLGGLPPEEFLAGVDPLLAGVREKLQGEYATSEQDCGNAVSRTGRKSWG